MQGDDTAMDSPAGTSSATYLDNGWEASRTLPNGVTTTYAYNAASALTGQTTQDASGTTLASYGGIAYDGVFNRTSMSASVPSVPAQTGTDTYGYDAKDRMTLESTTRFGGYTGPNAYDGAGNSTTRFGYGQGYDADNRESGTYDGNGNPTTFEGYRQFGYDPENRVTSFSANQTSGYRADGLRAWKNTAGSLFYYLYDGGRPVALLDRNGYVAGAFVYAPDSLVGREINGVWTQYAFDPQGNAAQRLDSSGNVPTALSYFGYGSYVAQKAAFSDPFRFDARWGYYLDAETGLYLCGHRYHDPALGRWLTRDPIGYAGGVDLYGYCGGNPVGRMDASGHGWTSLDAAPGALEGDEAAEVAQGARNSRGVLNSLGQWARRPLNYILGLLGLGAADPDAPEQAEDAVCNGVGALNNELMPGGSLYEGGSASSPQTIADAPPMPESPEYSINGPYSVSTTETSRRAGEYIQRYTYDRWGQLLGRLDETDHGRPGLGHGFPHWHPWLGPQGGWEKFPGGGGTIPPWLRPPFIQ